MVDNLDELLVVLFRLEGCQVLQFEQAVECRLSDEGVCIVSQLFDNVEEPWIYLIHTHLCQGLKSVGASQRLLHKCLFMQHVDRHQRVLRVFTVLTLPQD